jgi:hypothetical protein
MSFILDMGSGNSCRNDQTIIKRMIDAVAEIDHKRIITLKWQLFIDEGQNVPLSHINFQYAYNYARLLGFKTTASVFDIPSLNFLLQYDISFVKIANRPDLYWLVGKVPREINVIVSSTKEDSNNFAWTPILEYMCCISKYPCNAKDYQDEFNITDLWRGISDHTCDWKLYRKCRPDNYEVHFKLPDSTGLDAGEFARTPDMLKEIYNDIK